MARVRKEKKQRNARDTEFEDESSDGPDTPREFEELQEEKRTARKEIIERIKKMPRNRGMVSEGDLDNGINMPDLHPDVKKRTPPKILKITLNKKT